MCVCVCVCAREASPSRNPKLETLARRMVSVSVADRNVSERDLHVSKETCMCQKRPTCVRRVLDVFGSFLRNVSERAGETGYVLGLFWLCMRSLLAM